MRKRGSLVVQMDLLRVERGKERRGGEENE